MSLFSGPAEHAANPPSTWEIRKRDRNVWALVTRDGVVVDRFRTRREAEAGRDDGFAARLYRDEAIWYAGGSVRGWRPYADVVRGSQGQGRTRSGGGRHRDKMVCPECGESAVARPPRRWTPANGARPSWSHADGEPLCPVVGPAGYQPAQPVPSRGEPRTKGRTADRAARRAGRR